MTEDISVNKEINATYVNSNCVDTCVSSNLESNVHCNKVNGEITEHSDSVVTSKSVSDKKSFHITSVTVQHNSTDGYADEFADESRTEELSDNTDMSAVELQSRLLDFKENVGLKDDVIFKVTSVGSAPIIPTSAQYGIALVSNPNTELTNSVSKFITNDYKLNDNVSKSELLNEFENNYNSNGSSKDLSSKNERFKVVKIESNEPFKRGRWICMDFLDQSMDQLKKSVSTNDDKSTKKDTLDKDLNSSEMMINGIINNENISCIDMNQKIINEAEKVSQVLDSINLQNSEISNNNSVSPNQTYSASVSSSNTTQSQAQSLTQIIIPQGTQAQIASGSYGHSQSLTHSELQHTQTAPQQQQQQSIHVVSSLQQSFHPQATVQPTQGILSQSICPTSAMQHISSQQQQPDAIYSQSAQPSLIQQQYQTLPPSAMSQSNQQCNTQRVQPSVQAQQSISSQQVPNIHCMQQLSQPQSNQSVTPSINNESLNSLQQQTNQPNVQQFQQNQQSNPQSLQHSMQQVPIQQPSFSHSVTQSTNSQQIIHQPVQSKISNQHPSQQTNQQSIQQIQTQSTASVQQPPSQPSLQQSNIQPPLLQNSVSHISQQQNVTQPTVQFLPQQSSHQQTVIQQNTPSVLPQSVQQPSQSIPQQLQTGADQSLHIPVQQIQQNSQSLHQTQTISQPTQQQLPQQQMLPQQVQSQIPQQQQISTHQQQMQHIPQQQQPPSISQQTVPTQQAQQLSQPSQQIPQQIPLQHQQIPQPTQNTQQPIPHHPQIISQVPQQHQIQSQPQQILQSQIPQTQNIQQSSSVQQSTSFQNTSQQTLSQPTQQVQSQVVQQCVQPQQLPTLQQSIQQHNIQSQSMAQPVQQPTIQHQLNQVAQHSSAPSQNQPIQPPQSMNGGQTMSQYQSNVTHQNVPAQINEQNIPASVAQSYQHDVVLSSLNQTDVLLSQNVPSQYPLPQSQNISVPTQLPLHVSMHQPYQNTGSSNYVISSQQTPPVSQQQFFSHPQSIPLTCSQPSSTISSQDLQLCSHQLQGMQTVTPLISSVSSQSIPPTISDYISQQNGSSSAQNSQMINQNLSSSISHQNQIPFSVHSQIFQSSSAPQTSSSTQTQTTPVPQSTSVLNIQHYPMQSVSSASGQIPGGSPYVSNVSMIHPVHLQQQNYIHGVVPTPQVYSTNNITFTEMGNIEPSHMPGSYLTEQVLEAAKNTEDIHRVTEDVDSSVSGNNAVAIDNKIEQAMDLVKSHLMFAVREEVEVLKEKIAELMDRINQLEIENSILKANASQETLAQLPTHSSVTSNLSVPTATAMASAAVAATSMSQTPPSGHINGQPP